MLLKLSTDLDAIWQIHFRIQGHHIASDGALDPQRKGKFAGLIPSQNVQLPLLTKADLLYDSPGGSIDQQFRLLPNHFGPCLSVAVVVDVVTSLLL